MAEDQVKGVVRKGSHSPGPQTTWFANCWASRVRSSSISSPTAWRAVLRQVAQVHAHSAAIHKHPPVRRGRRRRRGSFSAGVPARRARQTRDCRVRLLFPCSLFCVHVGLVHAAGPFFFVLKSAAGYRSSGSNPGENCKAYCCAIKSLKASSEGEFYQIARPGPLPFFPWYRRCGPGPRSCRPRISCQESTIGWMRRGRARVRCPGPGCAGCLERRRNTGCAVLHPPQSTPWQRCGAPSLPDRRQRHRRQRPYFFRAFPLKPCFFSG